MVSHKENKHRLPFWSWWRWSILGLGTLTFILSIIMSWHYLTGGAMVGCGGGSPCEQVLNTRWSTIAGIIPVSGLAMGVYLAILVATLFIGKSTEEPIKRQAWSALLILSGSVAGSALWFIIIQKWVIGHFCPYCMSAHVTGLLLASLIIWRAMVEKGNVSKGKSVKVFRARQTIIRGGAGLMLAGILAGIQIVFTPAATFSSGASQVVLPSIDYKNVPIMGSPDAPHIVTLLFDYECSHCQKMHFMLNAAVSRYNGKLAFVLCPTPLNNDCNPYIPKNEEAFKNSCDLAKISLAVWIAKREAFPVFENWVFSCDSGNTWHPRSLEAIRAKAVELVGEAKLKVSLEDPWIGEYIQTCTRIYGKTLQSGKGGVPKLVFGTHWVIPEPRNSEDFITILQNSLAVPKP